jgi:hypothetical protein
MRNEIYSSIKTKTEYELTMGRNLERYIYGKKENRIIYKSVISESKGYIKCFLNHRCKMIDNRRNVTKVNL